MDKIIFLSFLTLIALIDWKTHKIHNAIVLPAIAIGIYFTGYWAMALLTYLMLGAFSFDEEYNAEGILKWGGGDVKISTMVAAYLGWVVWPIIILTFLLIKLYRAMQYVFYSSLPVAPFALTASLMCFWLK